MNHKIGALWVVATPIGNLGDISARALQCLQQADLILAEDTRRTKALLQHYTLQRPLQALHQHNERAKVDAVVARLRRGQQVALVSDAGTPLISDPGFVLVRALRAAALPVFTVPGASALTAALSVCGIAAERFVFEGFLPHRPSARRLRLQQLCAETRCLVFYESSHRVQQTLAAMREVFGDSRACCIAREMTKKFESYYHGRLDTVAAMLAADPLHQKGEFVVVVAAAAAAEIAHATQRRVMALLLQELPLKKACEVAAQLLEVKKTQLYQVGLALKEEGEG